MKQLKKIIKKMYPPSLSNKNIQTKEINTLLKKLDSNSKILNIGSKDIKYSDKVINLDICLSANVNIMADAHFLPFVDSCFDGVIITAVLEIVRSPEKVILEIFRVLKNDGIVIATIPFLQPYHPDPIDCQRFTINGVENLFEQFEKIKLCNTRGIFSTFIWIFRDFLAIIFSFNTVVLWKIFYIIFGWLLVPFKYLDYILPDYKKLYYISSSFLYIGKKNNKN